MSLRNLQWLPIAYRLKIKHLSKTSDILQSPQASAFLAFSLMAMSQAFSPAKNVVGVLLAIRHPVHLKPANLL